jgi:hypothetical protein
VADTYVMVFNTTSSPVVTDASGRTVGGQEWGAARRLAPELQDAVNAGRLFVIDTPSDAVSPPASDVAANLAGLNEAAAGLDGLDRSSLFDLAASHGVLSADDVEPYKDDLVDMLARAGITAPAAPQTEEPTLSGHASEAAHAATSSRRTKRGGE